MPWIGIGQNPDAVTGASLAALEKFTDRRPVRLLGVRAELTPPSSGSHPVNRS